MDPEREIEADVRDRLQDDVSGEDNVKKLHDAYYSSTGYWRGKAAVTRLVEITGVPKSQCITWLSKQPIWQIYLPKPRKITYARIKDSTPNNTHQADLLYLPEDGGYKFALCAVDVASRYKEAEPLKTRTSKAVVNAMNKIYRRSPLRPPKMLMIDKGSEFKGDLAAHMQAIGVQIIYAEPGNHKAQGIVERFNRTLGERLFSPQYAVELKNATGKNKDAPAPIPSSKYLRETKWVKNLKPIIAELNESVTHLTGIPPKDAIKREIVNAAPSVKPAPGRPIGVEEPAIEMGVQVRYLYRDGELEGGTRGATDPIWSVNICEISKVHREADQPLQYTIRPSGMHEQDDTHQHTPKRRFVREELMVIPFDTEAS